MKRLLTTLFLVVTTITIMAQDIYKLAMPSQQINHKFDSDFIFINDKYSMPSELRKYYFEINSFTTAESVIQTLSNDTLLFNFTKSNIKHCSNIRSCSYDTIWIKDLKNKKKAKINKHYELQRKKTSLTDIESKSYKIFKTKQRIIGKYERSFYIDIYLHNIDNIKDSIIWTYHSHCNYGNTRNPSFTIKVLNATKLARRYFIENTINSTESKENAIYYFIGGNKYSYKNYKKVKCIDCDFYIDNKYLETKINRTFEDENGYKYDIQDFSENLISYKEYKKIYNKNIEAETERTKRIERIKKENTIEMAALILSGQICIGMTKLQCLDAIGAPKKINRTVTSISVHEQWVYNSKYLYFEDGILVTIQD